MSSCTNCKTPINCCDKPRKKRSVELCNIKGVDGIYTNPIIEKSGCNLTITEGEGKVTYKTIPSCKPVDKDCGSQPGYSGVPEKGEKGDSATIRIKEVVLIPKGKAPVVENIGTNKDAVYIIKLPLAESSNSYNEIKGTNFSQDGIRIESGVVTNMPDRLPYISDIKLGEFLVDDNATNPAVLEGNNGVAKISLNIEALENRLMEDVRDSQTLFESNIYEKFESAKAVATSQSRDILLIKEMIKLLAAKNNVDYETLEIKAERILRNRGE